MSTFMTDAAQAGSGDGGDGGPQASDAPRQRRAEGGSEDHWSVVLKKLAPQGYQKSPPWQQEIIERVVKQMTRRQKESKITSGLSKEALARTIDLQVLGISPEAAETFRAEEKRVASSMKQLPGLQPANAAAVDTDAKPEMTALEKLIADRSNQVHFYIRAIQMEQLLEQDLEQDLRYLHEEVGAATTNEDFGRAKADSLRQRLQKQLGIVKKRCEALTMKASEIASDNSNVRLMIDDLRKEKLTHREMIQRFKAKATKMDEDIAFLTHAAHAALDQREKVRGKFLMAQRDMQQEREQKLAVIAELVQRTNTLDDDWAAKQMQLAEDEEMRRREAFKKGRHLRSALEAAEVRFGFLTSQARGWESEFERLQAFTGMEKIFVPGQSQIVDEITNRYQVKERANTSLLRYLNEQQAEVRALEERQKALEEKRERLAALMGTKAVGVGGGMTVEELHEAASGEEERSKTLEELLGEACRLVSSGARNLWREGDGETPKLVAEGKCNVQSLEKLLQAVERQVFSMYTVVQAATSKEKGPPAIADAPLVLTDWFAREKVHKVAKVTVPEIHEALCQQAAQQRRGGELEDDDDEGEGEAARKEAEAKKSPFERKKVNKAQERQRIIDWARKRQASVLATQAQQGPTAAAVAGNTVRMSASAPALRTNNGGGGSGMPRAAPPPRREADSCALPAIGESAAHTAASHMGGTHGGGGRASSSADGLAEGGAGGPSPSACGGGAPPHGKQPKRTLKAAAQTASMPGLGSNSAPKDLGTVIYLLGTQSSSMNARRFLRPDA